MQVSVAKTLQTCIIQAYCENCHRDDKHRDRPVTAFPRLCRQIYVQFIKYTMAAYCQIFRTEVFWAIT